MIWFTNQNDELEENPFDTEYYPAKVKGTFLFPKLIVTVDV